MFSYLSKHIQLLFDVLFSKNKLFEGKAKGRRRACKLLWCSILIHLCNGVFAQEVPPPHTDVINHDTCGDAPRGFCETVSHSAQYPINSASNYTTNVFFQSFSSVYTTQMRANGTGWNCELFTACGIGQSTYTLTYTPKGFVLPDIYPPSYDPLPEQARIPHPAKPDVAGSDASNIDSSKGSLLGAAGTVIVVSGAVAGLGISLVALAASGGTAAPAVWPLAVASIGLFTASTISDTEEISRKTNCSQVQAYKKNHWAQNVRDISDVKTYRDVALEQYGNVRNTTLGEFLRDPITNQNISIKGVRITNASLLATNYAGHHLIDMACDPPDPNYSDFTKILPIFEVDEYLGETQELLLENTDPVFLELYNKIGATSDSIGRASANTIQYNEKYSGAMQAGDTGAAAALEILYFASNAVFFDFIEKQAINFEDLANYLIENNLDIEIGIDILEAEKENILTHGLTEAQEYIANSKGVHAEQIINHVQRMNLSGIDLGLADSKLSTLLKFMADTLRGENMETIDIDSVYAAFNPGAAQAPMCNGKEITVNLLNGESPTLGDDVIYGTARNDVIDGLGGSDTICAGSGDDTIYANSATWVSGGEGNDIIIDSVDADTLCMGEALISNGVDTCVPVVDPNNEDAASCIDLDGDGWGWDGTNSCLSNANDMNQTAGECIDTDGDGWGWNGLDSCIPPTSTEMLNESVFATLPCVDSDGDGWGWKQPIGRPDLGRSCIVMP